MVLNSASPASFLRGRRIYGMSIPHRELRARVATRSICSTPSSSIRNRGRRWNAANRPAHRFYWYFQFRDLPVAIHSMAVLRRLARVSSRLAPVIHWTYSRRQLGLNASYAASAFLFFRSAARK